MVTPGCQNVIFGRNGRLSVDARSAIKTFTCTFNTFTICATPRNNNNRGKTGEMQQHLVSPAVALVVIVGPLVRCQSMVRRRGGNTFATDHGNIIQ